MNSGQTIGNYELLERIGAGGMGEVFRARDTTLERMVAIKVVKPSLVADARLCERFRQEAKVMARLQQAGITQLYKLLEHDGQLAMVMEFAEGETLESLLARQGPLPLHRAVKLITQCLDAFDCAHRMGVVHRDVKPANLMVCANDRVKVMDFGVAQMAGATPAAQPGQLVGTPLYMAPEQIAGAAVDWRTDLYALGLVLFEMLTGEAAFRRDNGYAVMRAQVQDPVPCPGRLTPGLPPALCEVVRKALAKQPDERFQSAAEFRQAVTAAVTPAAAAAVSTRAVRRKLAPKWRYAGAVAALVGLVAVGALGFQSQRPAEAPAQVVSAPCPPVSAPPAAEPAFEMAAGAPLAKSDLILLLQAGTSNRRMLEVVNARGVSFVNGPESAGEILAAGGSHELNGVAALNYRPAPVAAPRPASALQGQSLLRE
jgi:serine/threonine-protein kinase